MLFMQYGSYLQMARVGSGDKAGKVLIESTNFPPARPVPLRRAQIGEAVFWNCQHRFADVHELDIFIDRI
jgi:hypothetical protein